MDLSSLTDLSSLVFLRRDALRQGYRDHQIAVLVRRGEWHRIRRGAYVSGEVWRSLDAIDRYRLFCRAVLRTAHESSVLTHLSAAIEWGAPVWGIPLDAVHVTRTDGRGGRKESGIVHHRGLLPLTHITNVNEVPVSTPARCALEMTTMATVEQALVTVNGLLHAGLAEPKELADLAHDMKFWPSSIGADLVVRLADPRLESPGETRTAYFMWANHLPKPIPQYTVFDDRGHVVARLDFALPEYGVFLEFDGAQKYRNHRRSGEEVTDYVMREKRREELVCQLTGWVCLRIQWSDLDRPSELAARIRRVLASRAG